MMRFMIDTNILLWYLAQDTRISNEHRSAIDNPLAQIEISIASLWEITIKSSREDFELAGDDLNSFFERIRQVGFRILPIRTDHLLILRSLPFHHKDPFDRLIVAQSLTEKLPLLYTDKVFEHYFTI